MGEGGGQGGRDIIHCSCHPNHRWGDEKAGGRKRRSERGEEEGEGRKEEGQSKREKRGGKEGGRRETVHSKMIVEDGGE